jgi:hypothetical protein
MTHLSLRLTVIASVCLAFMSPCRSEEVSDVLARARKLNEAGEPSEATAVLARAFAQQRDVALLEEWLAIDERRLVDFESKLTHKKMPPLPALDSNDTASNLAKAAVVAASATAAYTAGDASRWTDWRRWVFGGPIGPTPMPNPTTIFLADTALKYDAAIKEQRENLEKTLPAILEHNDARQRLLAIDECFHSMSGCTAAASSALQTAPIGQIEQLLPLKNQAQSQLKRLSDMRALFVSYDHLAPRVISARVSLVPNAFGVTGHYVTEDSLKHAAEMLGSVGSDWEYAHDDVKRLWLDAVSTLKQFAGKEQFEALQTLATVVGNSKHTPEQWEPK